MDFKQIQDLIKLVGKSNLSELKLEQDNFKITLRKSESAIPKGPRKAVTTEVQPAPIETTQEVIPAAPQETETQETSDGHFVIKSPMIGTFYRASSPEKEPFVKVGDVISKGDHICIIEAMKLFNEIESEIEGKVVKVLAEDATPVEYDQPLFLIDPSGV